MFSMLDIKLCQSRSETVIVVKGSGALKKNDKRVSVESIVNTRARFHHQPCYFLPLKMRGLASCLLCNVGCDAAQMAFVSLHSFSEPMGNRQTFTDGERGS